MCVCVFLFFIYSQCFNMTQNPLDFLWGGQKATLAPISKNVKKYFDNENVVRRCDFNHTLHEQRYDHYQGFLHTPGLLGLKNQVENLIFPYFTIPGAKSDCQEGASHTSKYKETQSVWE